MEEFIKYVRVINPNMHFLLTVSPVALMATATQHQVVVATTYSKSVLRAVAGYLADKYSFVDYFPSYEIISAHVMKGAFYLADMRSVAHSGVDHVMKTFFAQHPPPQQNEGRIGNNVAPAADVLCDEVLLGAFGDAK